MIIITLHRDSRVSSVHSSAGWRYARNSWNATANGLQATSMCQGYTWSLDDNQTGTPRAIGWPLPDRHHRTQTGQLDLARTWLGQDISLWTGPGRLLFLTWLCLCRWSSLLLLSRGWLWVNIAKICIHRHKYNFVKHLPKIKHKITCIL